MNRPLIFALMILALLSHPACWCAPRAAATSEALVTVQPDHILFPIQKTLFGVNVHPHAKANIAKPEVVEKVRAMGIGSCRFPNGCVADLYNWKNPGDNWASVDDFLSLCDAIGAEPYYTLNLQGGTEGLKGPAPEGLPLEETIKYQHLMPNPCGNTNYHFGTLEEALELMRKYTIERALAGKRPILHYEMGNENWGQSRTDWPPEVYAKTVEVFAKAMRAELEEAKRKHPELKPLQLYIVAVGYPVMGNNMQMVDTPDRTINVLWTGLLNKLHADGLIDAVQEHFYPYASANGGGLVWVVHNLSNIIAARQGIPNPRLNGYRDPSIAYRMPMEFTEWNVKCWGPTFKEDKQFTNPGFEDGLSGWQVSGGDAKAVTWAARRGSKGARITLKPGDAPCELSQVVDWRQNAKAISIGTWMRTDNPDAVKVLIKSGEQTLAEYGPKLTDMWERVIVSATAREGVESVRYVVLVEGPANVYIDEAKLYYTLEERGQCPISATTYEQQLFCVDASREMAMANSPRAHLHHLFGNYPCGTMTMAGEHKDLADFFLFFSGAYGDHIVSSITSCDNFAYYSAGNPWATDFNALAPDRTDVPMLSSMATRRGNTLYLLLVNRTSDRDINVDINLNAEPAQSTAAVRTLTGDDIDLPGSYIIESETKVARRFRQMVGPYSAQILTIELAGEK